MDLRRLIACAIWLRLGRCCRCYRKFGNCNHMPIKIASEGDNELVALDIPLNADEIREPTMEFLAELEAAEAETQETAPKPITGDA